MIRSMTGDWAQVAESLGPMDVKTMAYARHAFFVGNAAAMSRLLLCPPPLHGSGHVLIDIEQVDAMLAEIRAEDERTRLTMH
jgi:hypothetical protein